MAWQSGRSDRSRSLPYDWQTRRLRVLRRDGYRCQERDSHGAICGAPANEVDHVVRPADGGSDEPANLQALCRFHHGRKTAAQGNAARGPRDRRARAAEPHPGAI